MGAGTLHCALALRYLCRLCVPAASTRSHQSSLPSSAKRLAPLLPVISTRALKCASSNWVSTLWVVAVAYYLNRRLHNNLPYFDCIEINAITKLMCHTTVFVIVLLFRIVAYACHINTEGCPSMEILTHMFSILLCCLIVLK
jgi:hypothetical protein